MQGSLQASWWARACAAFLICAGAAVAGSAQRYQTLFSFSDADGAEPDSTLIQATDGNLYGTTLYGGAGTWGTIFKISPTGAFTTLYNFCSLTACADGINPEGLIQGTDGNFYGTTEGGGPNYDGENGCLVGGCGTVFKMTPAGTLTTLYNFCSQSACVDGAYPAAGLIQGSDGNFYGTTSGGGPVPCVLYQGEEWGCGTVFKITPSGTLTTLYGFGLRSGDGLFPFAPLVEATDGNFYGTTFYGGTNENCFGGYSDPTSCGTVFKLTPTGALTSFSFNGNDGANPEGGLVQAGDGNLYGTTLTGGTNGSGALFKITPGGQLSVLHSFCSEENCSDGSLPRAGLVQATDGNLYGTSSVVFKITTGGTFTTVYQGGGSGAALLQDTNGKFYGSTVEGGNSQACGSTGCGSVYRLNVGLAQFVKPEPASGTIGSSVNILGTALSGATAVTFNGIAANFVVASSALITTTVPTGATTGEIEVTTPHGKLRSNVPFSVIQ